MSLLDFGKVIFGSTDDLIAWMQRKHLLASRRDCPNCNIPMQWQSRNDITDGYRYAIERIIMANQSLLSS